MTSVTCQFVGVWVDKMSTSRLATGVDLSNIFARLFAQKIRRFFWITAIGTLRIAFGRRRTDLANFDIILVFYFSWNWMAKYKLLQKLRNNNYFTSFTKLPKSKKNSLLLSKLDYQFWDINSTRIVTCKFIFTAEKEFEVWPQFLSDPVNQYLANPGVLKLILLATPAIVDKILRP